MHARVKYRLYFGDADGVCRVRYDNERGKGDYVHRGAAQAAYRFTTINALLDAFQHDVEHWRD